MDKSAPSKWALERARQLVNNVHWPYSNHITSIATEFDAIRGSECAEVCRVALEELDGLYDYIPSVDGSLRADDAIERLRSLLSTASTNFVRERDEVTEKLAEFLEKLNGKIQTAGAERILEKNFGELAIYFSGDEIRAMRKALAAYRERMGRS